MYETMIDRHTKQHLDLLCRRHPDLDPQLVKCITEHAMRFYSTNIGLEYHSSRTICEVGTRAGYAIEDAIRNSIFIPYNNMKEICRLYADLADLYCCIRIRTQEEVELFIEEETKRLEKELAEAAEEE